MSVAETWVEALQIDPEKLNEWSALAPDGVPILVWCLQEGHISPELFLAWATRRYELPVVRAEYFAQTFDSAVALQLHKEVSPGGREWSPWFFPVEKWENVTLVACVEPPPDFDEPGFRCVLADARTLKDAWYKFMAPSEGTSAGLITAPEMPIGMETSQVVTVVKPFKLSLDNLEGDNIFQHKEPNKDELYSGQQEEETAPKPVAKAPTPPLPGSEDEDKSMVAEVYQTAADVETDAEDEGSRMHTGLDLSQLAELPPESEAPRAPTPPVPVAQPKAGSKPPVPKPAAAAAAGQKKMATAFSAAEISQIADETFTQLRGLYKNCFLMRCEGGRAILHKWDSTMKPNNGGKGIGVDLAFPTFFRILHKTRLPYHGYLVDSPAHKSFFAELKIKDLPGCVTALPIKDEATLLGVLVCIGDEPLQKLDMLKKAEESSAKLIEALAPSWAAGNVAA